MTPVTAMTATSDPTTSVEPTSLARSEVAELDIAR
jgi:hypothetical protein